MAGIVSMAMTSLGTAMGTVSPFPMSFTFTTRIIHLVNTTGGAVTVRLCLVPSGGTASQANALLWDFSIPANDFFEFGEGIVLPAGVTLQGLASSGNAINIGLSGTFAPGTVL